MKHHRRCRRVAGAIALIGVVGSTPLRAQQTRLPFDSIKVWSLLSEAAAAAALVPAGQGAALATAVAETQIRVRDFAGAEHTIAFAAAAPSGAVLLELGQSDQFAFFDRARLTTRLICGLYVAHRADDALAFARKLPAGADREWELAHLAALVAAAPASAADSAAIRRGDTPPRLTRAFDLAREVSLPEARLDALIAVANAVADSPGRKDVALAAFNEARRIRLADADRQASRIAMLIRIAGAIDRFNDARDLYAELHAPDDLEDVVGSLAHLGSAQALVADFAPRAIAAGEAIRDSAARASYRSSLRDALIVALGTATANRLVPLPRTVAPPPPRSDAARRAAHDSTLAASTTPEDMAEVAVARRDYDAARRAAERVPLTGRSPRRAKLFSELAESAYSSDIVAARRFLILAREALQRSAVDTVTFDDVAAEIAERQFSFGENDEGVVTLNLVHDPARAEAAVSYWGASTLGPLSAVDALRAYADRVRDRRVRDAVLLRMITGYLAAREATPADALRARTLSDSIGTPRLRGQAKAAVARLALQHGDKATARSDYLGILADTTLTGADFGRSVIGQLIVAGGSEDIEAWARSDVPVVRARRLIAVAEAYQRRIEESLGHMWVNASIGPDGCTNEF